MRPNCRDTLTGLSTKQSFCGEATKRPTSSTKTSSGGGGNLGCPVTERAALPASLIITLPSKSELSNHSQSSSGVVHATYAIVHLS